MADGVFTPAVSVTSAVGGIAVAKESVTKDIIPISIVSGFFALVQTNINRLIVRKGFFIAPVLRAAIWDTAACVHFLSR